jgi:hypothetical protein
MRSGRTPARSQIRAHSLQDVPMDSPAGGTSWLRDAVFYEIYPQSFADSDGDGIGDLPGALAHLD